MKKGKVIACNICGKETYYFPRSLKLNESGRFFCSNKCSSVAMKGERHSKETEFKKGMTSWIKGKHIRLNPEGEFKKGMIPWNKGKSWSDIRGYRKIRVKSKKVEERGFLGKTCKHCHKIIWDTKSGKWESQIFCSKECNSAYGWKELSCVWCGKLFSVKKSSPAQFCSMKCRGLNQSSIFFGSNHPSWRGGIKKENDRRKSFEGVKWRTSVFERDDYTCQECGIRGDNLQAHHIKPYKAFPESRYEINNGVTLCVSCHKKTDSYGAKALKFGAGRSPSKYKADNTSSKQESPAPT